MAIDASESFGHYYFFHVDFLSTIDRTLYTIFKRGATNGDGINLLGY